MTEGPEDRSELAMTPLTCCAIYGTLLVMSAQDLLLRARERLGVSQSRLARASGVSRGLINRYERGHVEPSIEQFNRLLAPLDQELTTHRLLTREDRRSLQLAERAAELIASNPEEILPEARRQLTTQLEQSSDAEKRWLHVWSAVLDLPTPILVDLITDTSQFSRALRQSSPLSPVVRHVRKQRATTTA